MLLSITLLAGCGTNEINLEDKIDKTLSSPYIAECVAEITSNKTENKYTYSCERLEDGTYTVDHGGIKLSVGTDGAVISQGGIDITSSTSEGELPLLPSYFFSEYLKGGQISPNDGGYLMECDISGDNPYRHTAEMEFDENLVPGKMCIKDKSGNEIIKVNVISFTNR